MTEPVFRGVGVALVTLFDAGGELDASATADHAARLVELGVAAVVVAGTTGEAATLDRDERVRLVGEVRAAVPAGTPVVAGTGAPSARQAALFTADAVARGADAVLVLSPPRTADSLPYYKAVRAAAGGTPVLAYHFPAVSPPGIDVDGLDALPVDGLKDSSGDPDRLLAELETFDLPLYVGSSALLSLAGPIGCTGAILALANVEPEQCIAAFAGDAHAQRKLAPAHLASNVRFPAGLKALVAKRFGTSAATRL
jgi:dihydrodipicolinate synthase/N-acetylneuraminate lyase